MRIPQKSEKYNSKKGWVLSFSQLWEKKNKEAPQGFFKIFVESDCKYIYFEELQMHKLE